MKKKIAAIMLSTILMVALLVPVGTPTRPQQVSAGAYNANLSQTESREIDANPHERIVDLCEATVNAEMRRANFENAEFCEYSLLVMFRQNYSMSYSLRGNSAEFREFTTNDFPELSNVANIRCATAGIEIAQQQIVSSYFYRGVTLSSENSQSLQNENDHGLSVDLGTFRRIKHIEFTQGSRQNIWTLFAF